MGAASIPITGAGSAAPVTVYFGTIPDRYNCACPFHPGSGTTVDQIVSANLLNIWVPYNTSFLGSGGPNANTVTFTDFITAPDGTTNTMQRMADTTANTQHQASAGYAGFAFSVPGVLRLAGFFKAAGRSRIVLVLSNGAYSIPVGPNYPLTGDTNCRCVFDLQGGQIGVAPAITGPRASQWSVKGQGIISYGSGVYQCYIDVLMDNTNAPSTDSQNFIGLVLLDNGTGTNAESSTYAGDGVSGVYGWKMNVMPPAAYAINQIVWRDEFNDNTMAEFDLANTNLPGFQWYLGDFWPYIGNAVLPKLSDLSVSGSVFTMNPGPGLGSGNRIRTTTCASLQSAPTVRPPQNGATVGQGWKPPWLIEINCTYNYSQSDTDLTGDNAWTAYSIEWQNGQTIVGSLTGVIGLQGQEYDFVEIDVNQNYLSQSSFFVYEQRGPNGGGFGGGSAGAGKEVETPTQPRVPTWSSVHDYNTGLSVFSAGTYYDAITGPFRGNMPPNASFWTTTVIPAHAGAITPTQQNLDAFHTFTGLRLPFLPGTTGCLLQFFDGLLSCPLTVYAPKFGANFSATEFLATDNLTAFLAIGSGSSSGAGTVPCKTDYIRVWQ